MAYIRSSLRAEMSRTLLWTYDESGADVPLSEDFDQFNYLVVRYAIDPNATDVQYLEAMISRETFAKTAYVEGQLDRAGWFFGGALNGDYVTTIRRSTAYTSEDPTDKRHIEIDIGRKVGTGTPQTAYRFVPQQIYGLR